MTDIRPPNVSIGHRSAMSLISASQLRFFPLKYWWATIFFFFFSLIQPSTHNQPPQPTTTTTTTTTTPPRAVPGGEAVRLQATATVAGRATITSRARDEVDSCAPRQLDVVRPTRLKQHMTADHEPVGLLAGWLGRGGHTARRLIKELRGTKVHLVDSQGQP